MSDKSQRLVIRINVGADLLDVPEGYTLDIDVDNKHRTTVNGGEGELWLTQDTTIGDIFRAFIQPLTLVDNSYGDNAIGWGARSAEW